MRVTSLDIVIVLLIVIAFGWHPACWVVIFALLINVCCRRKKTPSPYK